MPYDFAPAVRENLPLLIGVAGGTGSGKTYSALRIARGLAAGHPIAAIDTENRRMNHYADEFPELRVAQMTAPFRPDAYTEAIAAAVDYLRREQVPVQHRVVLVDSMSHEWAGDGGCLDWHDEITGGDPKKSPVGWARVKRPHKAMVTKLLQLDAHLILCFRAEPKVEIKRGANGQVEVVPKETPDVGVDGWMPITEKMLPYELTASFLLMAGAPGVPRPIKWQEQFRPFVPLDRPLSEDVGRALGEWAAGGLTAAAAPAGQNTRAAAADAGTDGIASAATTDPIVRAAGMAHPPAGVNGVTDQQASYTLEQIIGLGDNGIAWLKWAVDQEWPDEFGSALTVYARAVLTEQVAALSQVVA